MLGEAVQVRSMRGLLERQEALPDKVIESGDEQSVLGMIAYALESAAPRVFFAFTT
jgi:hypothetical protein